MKVIMGDYPECSGTGREISVQIDEWDTWDLSHTLALIIAPALVQLKKQKMGIPMAFCVRSDGSQYDGTGDDMDDELSEKLWNDALDKMIYAFQTLPTQWEDECWDVMPELDFDSPQEVDEDGMTQVLWKNPGQFNQEKYNEIWNKIQEGLKLFGEHYLSLWT